MRGTAGEGAGRPAPSDLPLPEQRERAREAALRLLASRERSAAELRQRLRRKGFDRDVVEGVLERLRETGLQDDARFAERFAAEAAGARGMASRRIRTELLAKGVGRDLAAVAATQDPEKEEERARALARKRAARMEGQPPETRKRRLVGLLARRGYDPEVCHRVAAEFGAPGADD